MPGKGLTNSGFTWFFMKKPLLGLAGGADKMVLLIR